MMPKLPAKPAAVPTLPSMEIYGLGTVQQLRDDVWYLARALEDGRDTYDRFSDQVEALSSSVDSLTTSIDNLHESFKEWAEEMRKERK